MKILFQLLVISGILIPQLASAQLVVSGPETAPIQSSSNTTFHNFVIAMYNDSTDLYTSEGLSLSVASPIYFNYMPSGTAILGDWSTGPAPGAHTLEFVKVPNIPSFTLPAGITVDIGFIGEESVHNNEFGINAGSTYTKLFAYNAGGDNPPMSYQVTARTTTNIEFQHCNYSHPAGTECQNCPERFRIYRVLDNGQYTNEYLFAVSDRSCVEDADYDDGFFYISGGIQPVPEPAHVGLISVIGLLVLFAVRRRIRRR